MFERIMTIAKELTVFEDVDIYEYDGIVYINFHDFAGFNAKWEEVYRPYEQPDLVDALLSLLDHYSIGRVAKVDGHEIQTVFDSDDI